jgi:transposase
MSTMYFCGIDLHATTCLLCIIDGSGEKVKEKRLCNEGQEILQFLAAFSPLAKIAVESTNNWYWLVDMLMDAGYDVVLAHTVGLSAGRKHKTDRRDAYHLARKARSGDLRPGYIYPRAQRGLRDLVRRRHRLVRERTGYYTQLRGFFLKHNCNHMSFEQLRRLDLTQLAALPLPPETRLYAELLLEKLHVVTKQLDQMEDYIQQRCRQDSAYAALLAIPGFGPIITMTVLCEIGDIGRFPNARCFSSYCRLVPAARDSGGKAGTGKGGKQGNRYLKWAFMEAAVQAVRSQPRIRSFRDRKWGHPRTPVRKLIATSIVAHKLGLAVYRMLQDGELFDMKRLFT